MPIESLNSRNTSTSATNRSASMPSTWMLTSLRADVPTASPAVNIMADAVPRASSGLETASDHGDGDKSNDHAGPPAARSVDHESLVRLCDALGPV
jgi:hypothetical protein